SPAVAVLCAHSAAHVFCRTAPHRVIGFREHDRAAIIARHVPDLNTLWQPSGGPRMVELEVVEKPPVAAKRAAARPAELAGPKAPTKRLSLVARDVIEQDALDAGRIAHDELIAEHALCFPDRLLVSHYRNRGERIVFHRGKRGKEQKLGSIRSD